MSQKVEMRQQSQLPKGWRWLSLEWICSVHPGQHILEAHYNREGVGIGYLTGPDDFGKIFPSIAKWTEKPKAWCQPGDILVTVKGAGVGKSNLAPEEKIAIGRQLMAVRPKANILDQLFLYNYLVLQLSDLRKRAMGSTVPGLSRGDIEKINVPLPPLPEQRRIAARIQDLMQDINRARAACEKQLEAAQSLPAAHLREVFESDEAKKWEMKKLEDVCKIFSGSAAPQEEKYFENGKYPLVRVQDLGRFGRTVNLVDARDHINDLAIKELNMIKAEKGTILFPKSGAAIATNNRAILGIDAFVVSHLAALKPFSEVAETFFVYYWLCLIDFVQFMENLGYPSLKLSTISKIAIPVPPLSEQRRIATKIQKLMQEVESTRAACKKQLGIINSLPQKILEKAFRGKL